YFLPSNRALQEGVFVLEPKGQAPVAPTRLAATSACARPINSLPVMEPSFGLATQLTMPSPVLSINISSFHDSIIRWNASAGLLLGLHLSPHNVPHLPQSFWSRDVALHSP